ncbi:hypothetical protein PybrP1_006544 [[Pythium] brassicae (nom. inval.)]|nr:hypothetical protein PybrP1_006544 [[Pythium] brassicae (nom. inval.)]
MEFTELAHDRLLHELDLPRQQHADDVLAQAQKQQQLQELTPSTSTDSLDEHSPLLPATATAIAIADALLSAEEQQAVHADERLSTWEIVRVEWRLLARLSAPMMAAGLLDVMPEVVLNIMAGRLSESASTQYIAALSLASLFQVFVTDSVVNGFSSAMDTRCSQAFGAGRLVELWLFVQAGALLFAACLLPMVAVLLSGGPILRALGQDAAIAAIAGSMLVRYACAIPFSMAYATMKSALQAQNIAAPFMAASLLAWPVSGVSAYLLAYHTPLGIVGVAMASPISWCVKSLVLAPVLLRNRVFLGAWPGWQLTEALGLAPRLARLGISSVLMINSQMIGFGSISLLAGLLPNASVMMSANGILVSLLALSIMPLMAFCVATAIRIGNALGAGQARRAALLSRVVLLSSFGIALAAAVVMGIAATTYAGLFTSDVDATREASALIHKLLAMVPILGLMLGLQGIFRACGKQLLCAQFNFAFMFVLGMPLGLLFALRFDAGVTGLWVGHSAGIVVFLAAGLLWLGRLDWPAMAHDAKHSTHVQIG